MIVNEAPRIDTLLENGKQCILPGSPITLTLKNSQSIARYQIEYQADGGQWEEVAILSKSGTDGQPVQFMILDGLTLEGRLRIKAAIPTRDGNGFCEKIMYGEAEVRPGISLFEVEGSALYCVNDQPEVSIRLTGSSPGIIYRLVPSPMPAQDVTLTGDGNPLEFKGHYPAGYYHIVGESQYCRDTMNGEAMITASPLPALYDLIVKQHICPGETTGILQLSGSETGIKYDLNIRKGESWEIVHTYTGNGQPISMPGLLAGDYRIHARNTLINCDQEFPMTVSLEEKASPSLCNLKFAGNDSVYCLNSISNIALSYPCYETGSSYQLKRNGIAEGNVITGNNLNWSNLKEGDYTLEVINEWGCPATTAIRRITGQAAPETFTLTGTQIYCTPGQTGCYLELNDSKAGIEYSFRRLSGSVLKDTISRGGTIRINVWPPEEEEFIVVATDTTPEQCQTTMQGSVRMEQSRIKVVPESPVIVNYNESIPLTLAISDYTGELRIRWDNTRHLIATGENTLTPQTVTLTESYYFPVTVSDDNCDIQSGVQVNCIGGDLKIRILQSDGMTAIGDTLRICDENLLTLCGMASRGATGNYQYRWTDGGREIGQSNPLTGYLKTTDGYIYAEVKDNHETAKDSVWIVVNETSRIDTLLQNGIQCILPGEALTLTLKNSQSAASYQVEHQTTDGEWQVVTSLIQSGNDGQPLEFMISDALRLEGRLRIKATLPTHNGGESCEKIMYGEAEVRQAINRFETTGIASHCAGEHPEISILLSGSTPGINYRLIPAPSALTGDLQQAGNGNPFEFKGFYPDGHYRIVGESLYCRDTMNGEAIITVHPLPVIETFYASGLHCTAEGPITPGISNALVNTVYTLTYTTPTGSTSTKDYHGSGQLFFDPIEEIGTYSVSARNTITGCRETYTWYHDGGKIPESNRKYYNIDSLKPQDYGEYYCEATNACGLTVSSIPVNLEVRELVKVETPLSDRAICDNKGGDIMLAAGFRNATSFRWFRTDQPEVTLSNTVYLKLTGNDASVAGTYICAANNQCNTEVQDSSVISFGFTPDILIPDLQTDTLCVGSIYDKLRVIPGQGVIPEWYLGETPLKIKGNELILRSVETKDEGTYQVKVANACGEIIRPVGTLYVDDYMHVTDASNPTMIRCLGSSEHLFVNISPSKRVKYTWEYTDGTRVNGSSELTVGPFQEVTTQIYWVRFMNKCGMAPGEYNYREFVVHVPKPFVLPTDLPREIITCANGQDTVIRLNMDPSTYANYKWWYRKNRSDVKRELLPSTTDTLEISCSTDKPGYYYCDLSNACDAKTTETIWVRIDSIPVILGSLANDTICEGGQLVLNLPATGGGLHYDWYILKAGSSIPEIITDIQEEYESVGELRLTATAAHDNCEIWCHIHNNCGEKFSNRIRLSVDKRRQVEITPADTTICAGSYAEIRITLHNGTAPWCYRYTQEENPDIQETRIAERLTDVLDISQRGNYTETFVSDGGKCNYADGNSTFRSNNYYVPEARISLTGQDSLCRGEKTQLSVSVSYPPLPAGVTPSDGPWEIVIPSVFASRYVWILC